jgi:hypothetical protein
MTSDWSDACAQNETKVNPEECLEIAFRQLDKTNENDPPYGSLKFSESALYWASVTVGAPSDAVARQNYLDAPAFAIHKWSAICSVLDFQNNRISLRKTHKMLDPSEKGVLSYWTGMVFAKLVAEKILHVPWAAHASILYQTLKKEGTMQLDPPDTKSLPDLVCYEDIETYHIIEAKGRVNKPTLEQAEKHKNQTQRISFINEKEPESRNVCLTLLKSPFMIDLIDPEKDPEEKLVININPLAFLEYYYKPVVAFLSEKENNLQITTTDSFVYRDFVCDCIDRRKYRVGMVKKVFEQVKGWKSEQLDKRESRDNEKIDLFHEELKKSDISKLRKDKLFREGDSYLGSDGIFVQLFGITSEDIAKHTSTPEK